MPEADIVVRAARIRGRPEDRKYDVYIEGGRISSIRDHPSSGHGEHEIDARGRLLMPAFFNMHFHLDSVLTLGDPRFNETGTLWEGIEIWAERKRRLTVEEMLERVERAVKWMTAYGTLWLRTHADTTEKTLATVRGLIEARERFKELMWIQVTAFPQDGILTEPGNAELLEKAAEMGVDNIGMIPHNEHTVFDAAKSVEVAFDIAQKYGKDIDGHVDETDDPWSRNLEVVARETIKRGYQGRVAAGHVTASHSWDPVYRERVFELAARAGVSIVPNPLINIHLQGRFDGYPKRRGMAPIKLALSKGVNVALGHDCIMDPWYPLGVGDMLQALFMAVHVDQMMGYNELRRSLDLITVNAARIWHIEHDYGVEEGKTANLVLLKGRTELDALRLMGPPLYVIKEGRIVADNTGGASRVHYRGRWEELDFSQIQE
ncbi:MAG: amidohydrolase family protein [Desulfurococcales archaeon]|nr:amidohydrolase family protein [Desulfurococcales archaeon]